MKGLLYGLGMELNVNTLFRMNGYKQIRVLNRYNILGVYYRFILYVPEVHFYLFIFIYYLLIND